MITQISTTTSMKPLRSTDDVEFKIKEFKNDIRFISIKVSAKYGNIIFFLENEKDAVAFKNNFLQAYDAWVKSRRAA